MALVVKNPPANAGDTGDMVFIPGSGRCPGGRSGNPLQYSCLGNPMGRRAWQPTAQGLKESDMPERLSACAHTHTYEIQISLSHTYTLIMQIIYY